jgi:rifampicin phosphotransferase
MTVSDTSTKLSLDPPGPGSWGQDPVDLPRPMPRYFQETHPASFKKGTHDFARFYGMLIDGLQGFGYNQVLPAAEAEIPQRIKRAEQVFAQRLWREQLREWDESCKPSAIEMHRELQTVDRATSPTPNWSPI